MMGTLVNGISITSIVGNVWYFILALIMFDVVAGLIASAKERKLNSSVNYNGLLKKVGELIALAFVTLLDSYFKTNGSITKMGVGLLIAYEGMSIIENLSRVGVNLSFLSKYFDPNKTGKGGQ